jgi:uncharacterized membrane protein YraQ (UPF0718 family)
MKTWLKGLAPDIKIACILLVLTALLLLTFSIDVGELLRANLAIIIKILYLTVVAVGISTIIHFVIPDDFATRHVRSNSVLNLFYATLLGTITPGPVYAIYPIVLTLRRKGVSNPMLVAYLTGQTIIGPARAAFEVGFFGLKFYLFRIVLALLMGPLAGVLFIALSQIWPDKAPGEQQ